MQIFKLLQIGFFIHLVLGAAIQAQREQLEARGLFDFLTLFKSSQTTTSLAAAAVTTVTVAATTKAATAAATTTLATAAAATTTSTSSTTSKTLSSSLSTLKSWLQNLFGSSSSSSTSTGTSTATAATSTSTGTGVVSIGFGTTTASSTVSTSTSTSSDSALISEAIAAARGAKGITYSPYTESGSCKTASEVAYDIDRLTGFTLIRLYSTDCEGVENVLASMSSSQKLFLGIYEIDTNTITSGLTTIKSAVENSTRGWSAVHTISVGNERVNDGKSTVADLTTALTTTRNWLSLYASDYTGYVVTVDTLTATVSNTGLCLISDYLAVNSHPYWDGNVEPANSGTWLKAQIQNLRSACGSSKPIVITETGWPTEGDTNGICVPSLLNQILAIKSINKLFSSLVFMFTMYNDYWKDPGSYNVEQHWGIFGDPAA